MDSSAAYQKTEHVSIVSTEANTNVDFAVSELSVSEVSINKWTDTKYPAVNTSNLFTGESIDYLDEVGFD